MKVQEKDKKCSVTVVHRGTGCPVRRELPDTQSEQAEGGWPSLWEAVQVFTLARRLDPMASPGLEPLCIHNTESSEARPSTLVL